MLSATASAVDVLVGAVTDVFETMVFRSVVAKATTFGVDQRAQSQIVGSVGFTWPPAVQPVLRHSMASDAKRRATMEPMPERSGSASARPDFHRRSAS